MTAPPALGTITPYFTVTDADALIAFTVTVFDGEVVKEDRYADGTVQHARVRIGDSILMLNQATAAFSANVSQMHLFVETVEGVYTAALRAGAVSVMAPNIRPHGDLMAGVVDPCGNLWWIAQPRTGEPDRDTPTHAA
ncbi:MAG: VOC family protein [Pseudomonadota bacterium]